VTAVCLVYPKCETLLTLLQGAETTAPAANNNQQTGSNGEGAQDTQAVVPIPETTASTSSAPYSSGAHSYSRTRTLTPSSSGFATRTPSGTPSVKPFPTASGHPAPPSGTPSGKPYLANWRRNFF
jgi:hypothetical protein